MQATALKPRILSVDALRGFALFGIFFSHMIFWYAGGPLPETYYRAYSGIASMVSVALYFLLFNAKFFAIFAFLFGVSFHIQITNLAARSAHPSLRFAWRLAILGCLGVLHHMFWRADILSVYAIVGLLLIPARRLTNKTLAVAGMLLVFNLPTKLIELGWMLAGFNLPLLDPKLAQDAQAYYFAFTQANFAQMLSHNLEATTLKIAYLINSGRLCMTIGFFLLGMLVGRLGWFEQNAQHRQVFIYWCKRGAWAALIVLVIAIAGGLAVFASGVKAEGNSWLLWAGGFLFDAMNAGLTCIYVCGFVLLMAKPRGYACLAPLASIGKMALSVYIVQSIIGVLLFFNIGLGLFALTSPAQNCLLSVAIFGLLVFGCRIWLSFFQYGPLEWFWRCTTDLRWRALRYPGNAINY